jgi:CubicO group peptidase (beta-lactamase class C family)
MAHREADVLRGLDGLLPRLLKDWKAPGMAVAIVKNGRTVFAGGYGLRDIRRKLPATADTQFPIASCTKSFASASVGLLVDEKKVEWDKPVRMWLPGFRLADSYATEHTTLRDLLCHRTGYPTHNRLSHGSGCTRDELLARLAYVPSRRSFRAGFNYNNNLYGVAGCAAAAAAGTSWEELVRERLLRPLGMSATLMDAKELQGAAQPAVGYAERRGRLEPVPYLDIGVVGAAGAISSTARDMARWLIFHLSGGKMDGRRIISEATLREIHSPQVVSGGAQQELSHSCYALGWQVQTYRGHTVLSHGGGIVGFSSFMLLLPGRRAGVVALCNRQGAPAPWLACFHIADRLLGMRPVPWNERLKKNTAEQKARARKERMAKRRQARLRSPLPQPLAAYAGVYEHPGYGRVSIALEKKALAFTHYNIRGRAEHLYLDTFRIPDEYWGPLRVVFGRDSEGRLDRFAAELDGGADPVVFMRKKDEPPQGGKH